MCGESTSKRCRMRLWRSKCRSSWPLIGLDAWCVSVLDLANDICGCLPKHCTNKRTLRKNSSVWGVASLVLQRDFAWVFEAQHIGCFVWENTICRTFGVANCNYEVFAAAISLHIVCDKSQLLYAGESPYPKSRCSTNCDTFLYW